MPNKRQLLQPLSRALLLDIARTFEMSGLTAKPKEEIVDALMAKRSIPIEEMLETLKLPELKDLCQEFSIVPGAARKEELIAALVSGEPNKADDEEKVKSKTKEIPPPPSPTTEREQKKARMPKNEAEGKPIEQYLHGHEDRLNNPPVGLVTPQTDKDGAKKKYEYDPHLDPQLQWAGKTEHTSFEVPTVSLHVHERIDPKRIIEQVKKEVKKDSEQVSMFETFERPLREAVEFYKHKDGWTNRMIAGDSLLVMNSMIEKEGLGGKVQMVYFDPPYGITYGSNFQPFVNKRDVKDKDEDLCSEPEMLKAFRDTWELGVHSYLTYIRDRLLLARELLSETGSVFVQISDENFHHVKELMDEVFGSSNQCAVVTFRKKTMPLGSDYFEQVADYIIWYAKDRMRIKTRPVFGITSPEGDDVYKWVELKGGRRRQLTKEEINNHRLLPEGARVYRLVSMLPAQFRENQAFSFEFEGKVYPPPKSSCWKTTREGMAALGQAKRLQADGSTLQYVLFFDDYPVSRITALWGDTAGAHDKRYVVQTSNNVVQRCLIACTDPGDLVLDITCGSGTTAYVAEQWGRRWITCDTSRVAITLAKQRIMTAGFDYYELAQPSEGISSGFKYKTVPHITLKSIANKEPAPPETLYDQPFTDTKRKRVTGPFTVEAVPAPTVKSFDQIESESTGISDASVTRTGETLRQSDWREELLRTGVRGKNGQFIKFSRIEPMSGTRYIQAEGETIWSDAGANTVRETPHGWKPQKVLVCFGPEHAPLEQRSVEEAWQEARPFKPDILLFCAFQFDEEAAKDIDEMKPDIAGMQLLKVQMNADLLTDDLRKKRSSNESFWLIGQPEVELREIKKGPDKGKYQVEVHGFDYYNPKTGTVESGGKSQIALWMLDTDYDNRSIFPSQVFFPMSGGTEGWGAVAKNLRAEIDEEKIEAFRGTVSLPFMVGGRKQVAVKIVDDRGIESLKIIRL